MKHRLLSLLFATLVAVSGFSAINYSLNESFESGIPASWTQEVVNPTVGGEWILDTLATYPDGAYDGEHRAALRSLEGTVGYCVRLVTPELNLSQVNNPQLSFAYAQVRRGSSQAGYYSDTLSVYYRTSSSSNWILIRKLAEYQPAWKLETLDLPAAAKSAGCQLAFEAKENGGRGVVLDYVRVFPKSTCMDVELSGVTVVSDAALISWTTNPNPFEVIISASKITDPSSYDHSQAVYYVDNYTGNGITIENLDSITTYYAYVRTHCSDNESGYTSWVSTTFTTANKLPYTHALAAVPANWLQMTGDANDVVTSADLAANTSTTYKWAPTTSTAVFGKAHLCGRPNSSPIWLLSTAIDLSKVEATSHVDVSFDFALTNNTNSNSANSAVSSAKLHIYSSGDDGATWTLERTIVGSEMSNLGKRYHVLVDNYIGSTVRLAIVAEGSSSHYFHIADFSVAESDGVCLGLYGLKSTVSPNSATFRWSVVGVTNAAEVILSDSANFANPISIPNLSVPTAQFNGLTPNTTYYLMVRQDCEGGDTLIAKIKTPCDPMVISQENAWTEDFNSYAAGDFIADCWKNEHISGTGAKIFDIYSSSNGGNSTKQLRLPDMSRGTMTLLALPPMTIDQANSYIFQLDVYRNATGTSNKEEGIRVYVSSKDEIDDNAVELGFISRNCETPSTTGTTAIPAESASGWYTYSFEIPMSGNLFVLLRGESQYGSSTYMDNFMVSRIPDCRKVKGLNVDNIGISTARATFNSNGAAQYELLVVTKAMDPDTLNTPSLVAFQVQGTDTTYAISGLSASTVYYAYARALCGESNGEWSSAAIFTTECGPMTVTQAQPWEEDFNSYPTGDFAGTCWFNKHTAGSSAYVFTIATTSSNGNNSTKQLKLPDMSDGNITLLGLPQLIVEEAGAYTFSLDVYRNDSYSSYTTEGIRIFASLSDTIDNTAVELAFIPRVYSASSSTVPAVSAVGWYTYTYVIPVAGPSVRILIQGESRYGNATYMDNFKIVKLPSCRPATGITLANVTSDAVSLRYTGVSSAQQYHVIVSTASIDLSDLTVGTIVYDNMVSGTSVDISNLASSTRYYVYIRSYCGNDEYSAWSDEFTFRTQCAAVTVADFGLETFEDPASTDCWTFGFGTPGTSTSGAYAQRDSLKAYGSYIKLSKESVAYTKNAAGVDTVYNDGAYAITPQLNMNGDDIRNYQISFMAATTSNLSTNLKRLNIGVMANPSDFSSMQTLKTIDLDYAADSMALKSYTVSLANVEEDIFGDMPSYVIFQLKEATKHDSTNFALIDNIIFEPASGCEQILESRVDSLEGTWADLSWENTGANSYEVLLSDINTRRPDTISNPIYSEEVSATNIHLTNLTGNTLYYAYVRGFCAEDTAKWSNALVFRTTQTPVVPPYADDFESDLQWLFVNGSEPNIWIWGNNVKNGGEKSLYISNDESTNAYTNNVNSVVFATKYFQFDKTGTYIFQYDWKAAGESTYDYLRVALAPYDEELVAGNLPASMSPTALPDGWIALDGGGKLNLQTTWQTVTEEVKVPAGKYKVVFVWKNDLSQGDNPPAAIDNFSIEIIDCPKPSSPNVTLTPGNGSIATISWEKEFEDVNSWLLEYATDTAFSNAVDTIVSDTIVDLTGLTPETVYYARLKSLCAEDAESDWSAVISFLPTDAYLMTVFDGSASNDVVPVYGNWVDNLMVSQFIIPADSIRALQWGSITQLTFFSNTAETNWGTAQFEVYMAEVQDTTLSGLVAWNTMTKVLNATSLAISDNQMVVTLDQPYAYENGNLLIGFKQTVSGTYKACSWKGVAASTGASYGGYGTSLSQKSFLPMMDIYYLPGEQPTCPKVRGIQIDHIDADSARIAVRDQEASGYHFLVASSQISPDAMSAADSARLIYDETVTGDTVLHINGLRSASTYYVYVSAICGDDQSPWSGASFVSACAVYTIADGSSYSENFNLLTSGIPTCWDNSRGTVDESHRWSYYSQGYDGACLRFNSYNAQSQLTDTLVTPALFLQDDAILSFYWKNPTGGAAEVFVSTDGGITKTVLESNLIGKSDWTKYEKNLSAYTGQRIQIFFASTSNYGNGDAYHYLDNFKVGAVPSCAPVTGVAYELTMGNGSIASISWSADTIAPFVVEYSTAADFTGALSVTVSDTTAVTLSGLTPETTYYAHVKVICDASSESEWSDVIRFTPSNAYALTINNGTATSSYIPFYGYYADGGESNGQFIIPASSLTEIQWSTITQLTFYTGTTSVSLGSDTWAVYAAETSASTLTELVDWSTLTKVRDAGTVSVADGKMVITFDTPFNYEDGNLLIGFEQTGGSAYSSISWIGVTASSGVSYYSYFDYDYYYTYDGASSFLPKMTIDYIPGEQPACFKPTGLAAELTMGDGTVASLSWNTEAAKSVIQYATTEDFAEAVTDTIIDTTAVALSGLTPETVYYARVQSICEGEVPSDWSAAISFLPTNALSMTIANGTTTNEYMPIYGMWTDNYTYGQFIVPADSIEALQWDTITQLTFYSSDANISWGNAQFEVYMAEVSSTTINALEDWNSLTQVKSAGSLSIVDNQMVVDLNTPFAYTDGNLLIGIKQTTSGTYKSCHWYGTTLNGASFGGYGTTLSQRNFLPKVTFGFLDGEEPACIAPKALKASAISSNSADLRFKASAAPSYELVVALDTINPDTLNLVDASLIVRHDTIDTAYVALTGLVQQTEYYVYVRGLCNETELSTWSSMQFTTRCVAAVPFEENFDDSQNRVPAYEGATSDFIPTCWSEGYESRTYVSKIVNNTTTSTYAYSAPGALYLNSSSTYKSFVVLPELDAQLDTLQLTFKARAMYQGSSSVTNRATSSYAHSVKVGTMTDPEDYSTFKLLDTHVLAEVSSPASADSYWEDVTIYLQGAQGKYIALVSDFDKSNEVWIDDIEISKAPDCLAPSGISVAAKTTTADISWGSVASRFEVAFGPAGFVMPNADTIITVTDTTGLRLENLVPGSAYDIYLRAECAEDLFSDWSAVKTFATAAGVPFNDDFENGNFWTLINGSADNKWSWGTAVSNEGTHSLYISEDGGASHSYDISSSTMVFATRTIFFEEGGYVFGYDWMAEGEVSSYGTVYDYLRVALVPENTSLAAGVTPSGFSSSALPTGWIALDNGALAGSADWNHVYSEEIHLDEGAYTVVLAWKNDGSTGSNPPAAIDNFSVVKVECSAPSAPRVSNITTNGVTIHVDTIAEAYEVIVLQVSDTIVKQSIVGVDSLVIESLSPASMYTVKARGLCGEGVYSNWSAPVAFGTSCAPIATLPWDEDFEAMPTGNENSDAPMCWDMLNTNLGHYPNVYVSTAAAHESTQSLYFKTSSNYSSGYAILPEFEKPVNLMKVSFYYKHESTTSSGDLQFGYMTDISSEATFVPLVTCPKTTTWTPVTVMTTAIPAELASSARLVFRNGPASSTTWYYAAIDDIHIEELNPNCLGIENLSVSSLSLNAVTIDFRFVDGLDHNAHVAISKEAAFDPSTAIMVDTIADSTYTFNIALDANTLYYVYARQDCGEGESSAWESISFRSNCVAITELPWSEGFEGMELGNASSDAPECWDLLNANQGTYPYVYVNNSTNYVQTGTQSLYFQSSADIPAYAILPEFGVAMDSLQVSFAYRNEGVSSSNGTLSFGYMTDIADGGTFVQLAECKQITTFTTVEVSTNSIPAALGHSVRLAFRYSGGSSNNYYAAVDDIRINKVVSESYAAEICNGNDYVANGFNVTEDDYHVGENTFISLRPAVEGSGRPDTISTLTLTVHEIALYEDSVVLCEGEMFSDNIHGANFNFEATLNMSEQVRYVPNAFGCEDIVRLRVTVNPKVEEHIYDSIAQGDNYVWHGKTYLSATVAEFDTLSLITGCDSTVYLHLSVYVQPDTLGPDTTEAVGYIEVQSLVIAPNPVKAGEPFQILNTFSEVTLAGVKVEIFSATGALVYTQKGVEKPFILPGLPISGLYTVRVIAGDEIYIASLLVH